MFDQCRCFFTPEHVRWAHPGCFAFHDEPSVGVVRPDGQEFRAPDSDHPGYLRTVERPSIEGFTVTGQPWTRLRESVQ